MADDDYRPNKFALSNAEVIATGVIGQGAVANIARELIERRQADADHEERVRELRADRDRHACNAVELMRQRDELRAVLEAMVSDVNRGDYHTRRTAFEKARAALAASVAKHGE